MGVEISPDYVRQAKLEEIAALPSLQNALREARLRLDPRDPKQADGVVTDGGNYIFDPSSRCRSCRPPRRRRRSRAWWVLWSTASSPGWRPTRSSQARTACA